MSAPSITDAIGAYDRICSVLLNNDMDTRQIIAHVTECAVQLSRAQYGGYFKNTGAGWDLYALSGLDASEFQGFARPRITELFQPTYEGRSIVRSDDILTDRRYSGLPADHPPLRSYMGIPVLRRGGGVQGALLLGHPQIGRFNTHTERLMQNVASLAAVALDNAERVQHALEEVEERKRAETRFRDLIEHAPSIKWYRDYDGGIEFYNRTWCEYTGLTSEASSGKRFFMVIHPDDREYAMEVREPAIKEGRNYHLKIRFRRRDGVYRWFSVSVSPLIDENGKVTGWVGTGSDVHDMYVARSESERARSLLRSVIDSAADPIFVKDTTGRYLISNHATDRICGQPMEGKTDVDCLSREQAAAVRENDAEVFKGVPLLGVEEVVGDRVYLSNKVPWHDESGNVIGVVGIARDITESKRSAERERLLLDELNHRVKNTLATIQSIATQTVRLTPDPKAFEQAFIGRLHAMSLTHNILTTTNWSCAKLSDVIVAELTPYHTMASGRWMICGSELLLNAAAATNIGMMIHELTTNAVKYGALSEYGGCLKLWWEENDENLHLTWAESGGPAVNPPTRTGFGTRLFKNIARSFNGKVQFDYAPSGFMCLLEVPLTEVIQKENSTYLVTGR